MVCEVRFDVFVGIAYIIFEFYAKVGFILACSKSYLFETNFIAVVFTLVSV